MKWNRQFVALGAGLVLALGAIGAMPTTGDGLPIAPGVTDYCGEPAVCDLFAGQDNDVGSVTVVRDEDNIYVTYTLDDGATFGTLHLFVGTDLDDLPRNNAGNLEHGHFPYQYDASGLTEHTFTVPLPTDPAPVCGDQGTVFYVVAHAEVDYTGGGGDTAYGGCLEGDTGNRWWYYMEYSLPCCDEGGGGTYETAFAKGGWVWTTSNKSNPEGLLSLKLTKSRWGWAINLTATGETTYDIWAGAGLNDTDNGVKVGEATVNWNGTNVTVTYDLYDGVTMPELHIYAGDLPPDTIAPGRYGHVEYFDPYANDDLTTLPLADSNGTGGVWLVLHAVVYGEF